MTREEFIKFLDGEIIRNDPNLSDKVMKELKRLRKRYEKDIDNTSEE